MERVMGGVVALCGLLTGLFGSRERFEMVDRAYMAEGVR